MIQLETERLFLRPWTENDAPALYRYARDPEVGPMAGWKPHESVEESRQIILNGPLGEPETYALVYKQTGEPIGSMGLFPPGSYCPPEDLPQGGTQLELGYWIARPYWGKGLVPEAAREMLRRAFEELDCAVAHCSHFEENEKSRRVIEKLGYRYRLSKAVTDQMGRMHNELCYVMTRREWEVLKEGEISR